MNRDNPFASIWMFIEMLLGLVIGCVIGIIRGELGTSMYFDFVFGVTVRGDVGIIIKESEEEK